MFEFVFIWFWTLALCY